MLLIAFAAIAVAAVHAGGAPMEPLRCGDVVSTSNMLNGTYVTAAVDKVRVEAASPHRLEEFIVVCRDKADGDLVNFGDSLALNLVASQLYLSDGDGADDKAIAQAGLDSTGDFKPVTAEDKTKLTTGEFFQWFRMDDTNNRDVIRHNDTFVWMTRHVHPAAVRCQAGWRNGWGKPCDDRMSRLDITADEQPKYGKLDLPIEAQWKLDVLCGTVDGKVCNHKGTCRKQHCECNVEYAGSECQLKRDFGFCHVTGDPHHRTFDGLRYNTYTVGEFILYQNGASADPEEVVVGRSELVEPHQEYTLNAEILVRAAGEIISVKAGTAVTIDCGENVGMQLKEMPEGMKTPSGSLSIRWVKAIEAYRIESAKTGLVVWARPYGRNVDAWIRVYDVPAGHAAGLCGNFDRDAANDLHMPDAKLGERFTANPQVMREVTIPPSASLTSCAGAKTIFNPKADNKGKGGAELEILELGDRTYNADDRAFQAAQEQQLLADARKTCYRPGSLANAVEKCNCLGLPGAFHLYADCINDVCVSNALADQLVRSDCEASRLDAVMLSKIGQLQKNMDNEQAAQEAAHDEIFSRKYGNPIGAYTKPSAKKIRNK